MLCRIEACLSGRKNILRWGRLGSGNPGHRGRPLPVVRPHYRFSCAIGGAAFRLQSRDGEGRGGGLLAAAAGNDQSVSGEGPHWPHLKHMSLLILLLSSRPMATAARRSSSSFLSFLVPKNAIIVASPTHPLSSSQSSFRQNHYRFILC